MYDIGLVVCFVQKFNLLSNISNLSSSKPGGDADIGRMISLTAEDVLVAGSVTAVLVCGRLV